MSSGAPLRPYGRRLVPIPTGEESAAFDRWAIDQLGVPQTTLMENAGRGAARVVDHLYPAGDVVGVVGTGNNGGDALVALRALAEGGRTVRAIIVGDREGPELLLHGWPLERTRDPEGPGNGWTWLSSAAVILDGLLGTGVRGAPRARQAAAIREVNACGRPVVALDVPSGVNADDGTAPGEAIRADVTVAFGWPKLGTLLHPGRAHAGRLVALDIGFPPSEDGRFGCRLVTPAWASTMHPARHLDTHKKAVGVLLLLAGGAGMAGAAVLAARAAQRAGAGLVRIASAAENRTILQTAVPGAIFVDGSEDSALEAALEDSTAVAAGPGLGQDDWARGVLARTLGRGEAPLLLDADALNLVARGAVAPLHELASERPLLVTPHPGEMARLAPEWKTSLGAGRVNAAREWATRTGAVLLLKGSPSLVASRGRPVLVDAMGSSDLATAGVGDVLSGAAGAFLAQGLPPRTAAALALYACGRAARLANRGRGLISDDLVEQLSTALAETGPGNTDLDPFGLVLDLDPAR
jgi:NAD(P)H-hydrate epimerase